MGTIRPESVAQRIVVLLWVCAFVVGTVCHVLDIALGGWLPYRRYALGLNLFWTALTFADPLAALLLTIGSERASMSRCPSFPSMSP